MAFNGARVLSLESRRAGEMATLVRKQDGVPFVAPSMREVELGEHEEAFEFGRRLLAGDFDGAILLTGVGTRLLWKTLLTRFGEDDLKSALARVALIVRGPKPSAAVREIGFVPQVQVPEPNTWREVLEAMRPRAERRIAVQEYGKSNSGLVDGLREQGREVSTVRIYGWALPEDTGPLREAATRLARREFEVVLLTTSTQLINLMKVATECGLEQPVLDGLRAARIGSIGPTTTETLEEYGIQAAFEPSRPKMGLLVNEMAAQQG
ncbi:MAG TPA: uroporphyrinogen-III synthase [Bryobacteraceae bacterium]|nr:uroporphyrinogen-III synthase [Bryobacteraceae bacterium]